MLHIEPNGDERVEWSAADPNLTWQGEFVDLADSGYLIDGERIDLSQIAAVDDVLYITTTLGRTFSLMGEPGNWTLVPPLLGP